jgi:hypothetical protein
MNDIMSDALRTPKVVDRNTFQAQLDALRVREKAHTREDSPAGWPQRPKDEHPYRTDGRPIVQWPRLNAGYSDDLGAR